tara:strand:+ start:1221 stop:1379 length:159 start_codon:yes stop_codon:yes gene_type:complete
MLLNELLKETQPNHPDYELLKEAIEKLQEVLALLACCKKEHLLLNFFGKLSR